ncbi:hypothetical protein SCA6_014446 [Theobroma cacao]
MAWAFKVPLARYKPHLSMVLAQIGYTILYFFVEASFNQGLNPHVYKIKAKDDSRNVFGVIFAFPHRVE